MLSATDIANQCRCEHRIHLDRAGDLAEALPHSDFLELLWESGRVHEAEVVRGLEPAVPAGADLAQRAAHTRELMSRGERLIYQGVLVEADLLGVPDLLERTDQETSGATSGYAPIEIKAASAYEGAAKKPKTHYLLQLSTYAELLERLGYPRPALAHVIDADGKKQALPLDPFRSEYELARDRSRAIVAGGVTTRPARQSRCEFCIWLEHCRRELEGKDDLTLVAGIGESGRDALESHGIATGAALAEAEPRSLITIKGVKDARANSWTRQARAQKRGTPELLAPWSPPPADYEISFDIEDFSPESFVYLYGFITRPTGTRSTMGTEGGSKWGRYDPVCAVLPEDSEEIVWRHLLQKIDDLETLGSYVVYVYSHHEKTALARLAKKYGGSAGLERFLGQFCDLQSVVRDTAVFPTENAGLKSLAQWIGFRWRDEDPSGAQSMVWWNDYMKSRGQREDIRQRVIDYNEDDVRASFALKDWLEAFSRSGS